MKDSKIKTLCYLTVPESPKFFESWSFMTEGFNLPRVVLMLG
jgi:hypothetical protein